MGRKKEEEVIVKIGQRVVVQITGFLDDSEDKDFIPEAVTTHLPGERAYVCQVTYRPKTDAIGAEDRVVIRPTSRVPVIGLNILKRVRDVVARAGSFDRFVVDEGEEGGS
jgi:hypothetical protein